jgi:hypothetical protein
MAKKVNPRFQGKIEPLSKSKVFYMVVVEGGHTPPNKQHEEYDDAFAEALRLAKRENKKAFVVQAITEVEMIPNVKQLS